MGSENVLNLNTLNVNGLKCRNKRNRVFEWIKSQKCSICFLQETHFDINIEKEMLKYDEFKVYCNNATTNRCGVAIVIKKSLNHKIIDTFSDEEGRIILINIEIDNCIFSLLCLYAPNCKTSRNAFFKKVNSMLKEHGIGIPILGGDFNDNFKSIDRKSTRVGTQNNQPVNSLKVLIKENKLTDIWRLLNENKQQFTWRRKDKSQASRIDMILIGKDFIPYVECCKIKPAVINYTDHQSIFLKFKTGASEKGRGYWKINKSVLNDDVYVNTINLLIDKCFKDKQNTNDIQLAWDVFKIEVREITVEYCRNKAKTTRENLKLLEKKLEHKLKVRDEQDVDSDITDKEINNLEIEIGKIYDEKAKGAQIRSREKWIELGEKNNSYFLGLEKQRQIKKSINKLTSGDGNILTDQGELLTNIKNYYENLYSSSYPDKILSDQYIFNTNLDPKIGEIDKSNCDGEITLDECTNAIFKMKLNRSPGLDGLTVEFYRKFWGKLKNIIVSVLNTGYRNQNLTYSQRTSVLTLLFKKGDPLSLDNYRPISLLNVDLKLLSYILAQRLKQILPDIINEDQTGYVKNRFIGFNLRQIQDIIDYTELYKIEGAIVFVDFSKAFDSLEWNFMLTVLKHFGFNDSFISWVKTLYNGIQTCVTNNGWISEIFKNTRGIRQGCPLSALLFVLSVEIMASRIRSNNDIKGINIKLDQRNHSIKISQLADDTTLLCSSKQEVEFAMNEIEIFGSFSGLKLNRNKTEGIWVGKLKSCKDKVAGISWTINPVKALGVYFGYCREECEKLNWENRINKMNRLFDTWGKRNLTILGKILITKTLVLPIFTYIGSTCIVPEVYIKEIESRCFKFIWDNKPDKVKRNTIIGRYEVGGLRMVDIRSYFCSLKAAWVQRLAIGEIVNWKVIPHKYFNGIGTNWLIFMTNNDNSIKHKYFKDIPGFYKEVLKCWNLSGGGNQEKPTTFTEIRKQILWNNKYIKFENKPVIFDNWIKSNIIYINDIIDANGCISQEIILSKLKNKSNWIAEIQTLKKAIPFEWKQSLSSENSVKSVVHFKRFQICWKNIDINVKNISNKILYESFIVKKFESSIGVSKWLRIFDIKDVFFMPNIYNFIFGYLQENKLKMFRWKLLQFIIPNRKLLCKWKITQNIQCNFCNEDEDYLHYFISCSCLDNFWTKIQEILRVCNMNFEITLKHLVLGYKIFDETYFWLNLLLTIIGFSIYKAYYVSEHRTKHVNTFDIFVKELKTTINSVNSNSKLIFIKNYVSNNY